MEGGVLMTIQEYLSEHNMTQAEFSRMVGISPSSINNTIKHGRGFTPENAEKLKKLGIEVKVTKRFKKEGDEIIGRNSNVFSCFKVGVRDQLTSLTQSVIYCWNKQQVEWVLDVLKRKKIAHYCYHKDCYWVVHYDKSLKCSEMD